MSDQTRSTETDELLGLIDRAEALLGCIRQQIDALLARERSALFADPGSGWQSIEAAPKDGTHVLLGWPALVGDGLVMSGYWEWLGRKWVTSRGEYHGAYAPTHWMPLPAPPAKFLEF